MSNYRLKLLTISACLTFVVTACQKSNSTSSATTNTAMSATSPSQQVTITTTTVSTPPTIPTLSPAMQFWVDTNQGFINNAVLQEHPNLTDKQKLCLKSAEGWSNYVSRLQPFIEKTLTPAEIAEADKFYGSATGLQFAMAFKQKMGIIDPNMPKMPLNAKQKKEIAIATQQPFMEKIRTATEKISNKEAGKFARSMMNLELIRCQI